MPLNNHKGSDPFVLSGILLSLIAMLPVWPVEGKWFGLPAWVVITVLACLFCSCFIAWAALKRWPYLEGKNSGD